MLPGEQILWQSGTGRFKLLSGANGRSILIKWAITVAVTLGIIGTYAAAATEFRSNVVVILLIIMGLIILSPVMECSNLRGQQYILTNQRAVLIRGDRRIFSMPIQAIDDARIVQVSPNETCLLLGSKITGEPQKQLRFWAGAPSGRCRGRKGRGGTGVLRNSERRSGSAPGFPAVGCLRDRAEYKSLSFSSNGQKGEPFGSPFCVDIR